MYKNLFNVKFLINILLLCPILIYSQVSFDDQTGKFQLYNDVGILEIDRKSVSINQLITQPENFKFVPTKNKLIQMRSLQYGYWLKIQVDVQTDAPLYLLIPHYGTDLIEFYQVEGQEILKEQKSGVKVKFSDQHIKNTKAIFELDTRSGQRMTSYLYFEGHNLPSLPFYISTGQNIIETSHHEDIFNGIMYGLMILIFIYNLILYIQIREKDNLYYSIWVLLLTLQFSIYKGNAIRYLWPEIVSINDYVDAYFCFASIFFMIFSFIFLKLKSTSRIMYHAGLTLIASFVILAFIILSGLADSFYTDFNVGTLILIQGIWSITAGVVSYRKGFKPAIYYIIANLLLYISIFIFFGYAFGSIAHSFAAYNAAHIGVALQILFFSIALSNKINLFKEEKEHSEHQKILLLEENKNLIEQQRDKLEFQVEERTKELVIARDKSDDLLKNILPDVIAEELKLNGVSKAKKYESVTILFTDFKGFTAISKQMEPEQIVSVLNTCFSEFDKIIEKYGLEKIKTIGDAYMAAGGIPVSNSSHSIDVVNAAFEIRDFLDEFNSRQENKELLNFDARIGIHTGPVVAGIVGLKKFSYDIWGDSVNIASRMESSGVVSKLNISKNTYEMIKNEFQCTYRGEVIIKGGDSLDMYFVDHKV